MSISIKHLNHEFRDVGKTIKSSKKYFLWEFVLEGNHHRVEMFHSKLSGKKKLCLDAKVVIQDKSYKSDFTYSFKLEKNYICVAQVGDKYDLRIDNRSFDIFMQEERLGKSKSSSENVSRNYKLEESKVQKDSNEKFKKSEQGPSNSKSTNRSQTQFNKKKDDDFFNETDFNFETGTSNNKTKSFGDNDNKNLDGSNKNEVITRSFANFMNEFSNSGNNFSGRSTSNRNNMNNNVGNKNTGKYSDGFDVSNSSRKSQLLDVNDIIGHGNMEKTSRMDNKEGLQGLALEGKERKIYNAVNMDIYNHNRDILSNLNLNNITDDNSFLNSSSNAFEYNQLKNHMNIASTNLNNYNNSHNYLNPNNSQGLISDSNPFNYDVGTFNPEAGFSSSSDMINSANMVQNSLKNNSSLPSPTIPNYVPNKIDSNTKRETTTNVTDDSNMNNFKKQLLQTNLINLDNLLEEKKKTNSANNKTSNYNFSFSSGVPMNYMNTEGNNSNQVNFNYNQGNSMQNYPLNMNSNSITQYEMVPHGYHNVYPGAGYNYGNMNMMSSGGIYPQFDGNFSNYPNPNNLNSMNNVRKNTPF